jgi:hypothetical protein
MKDKRDEDVEGEHQQRIFGRGINIENVGVDGGVPAVVVAALALQDIWQR